MILPIETHDCTRKLNGGSLRCVINGPHVTHVYHAAEAPQVGKTEPGGHADG